jgi:hypothetical protein
MSTRPDNIEADSPFAKYYEGEYVPKHNTNKCSEGYHWVKKHKTKNGTIVEGHCAKNPVGSTQKFYGFVREVYPEIKERGNKHGKKKR